MRNTRQSAVAGLALLFGLFGEAAALHKPYLRRPAPTGAVRATAPIFAVLANPVSSPRRILDGPDLAEREDLPGLSGLNGKAMLVEKSDVPSKGAIRNVVPAHCYVKDTKRSLKYAAISLVEGAACLALGFLIPMKLAFLPLWFLYAAVTGCVWTGMWVIAHECGHNAFSNNKLIQDGVGYLFHSLLLVPYFSWQHSHAVHHQHTNHITKGETHVPFVIGGREGIELPGGEHMMATARAFVSVLGERVGKGVHAVMQTFFHLVFGWPAYLLFGATGGPKYGLSNHFIPAKPFSKVLWPGKWVSKVWQSDLGVVAMLGFLWAMARRFGGWSVAALYVGPLLFTNCWLVGYTWLQHTDVDVPHLTDEEWTYMRGALLTIDRPYGKLLDHLHHQIGSTHVAHHVDSMIPHYHAREATDAIAKHFPKCYLFDPTPIHEALWRVSRDCVAVKLRPHDGRYTWAKF